MVNLQPKEHVIFEVRRHWLFFALESAVLAACLLLPLLIFFGSSLVVDLKNIPHFETAAFFLTMAWWLIVWVLFAVNWTNYYLDAWIVTNHRIIDVEQHGLFSRSVSECRLERVQDVTVEVHGMLPTLLKFGDVRIQTAGETPQFVLKNVPDPYRVKDLIARCEHNAIAALRGADAEGGH
jgi:uncharacterized membrane protein YdbT with pleckstrin-like domain